MGEAQKYFRADHLDHPGGVHQRLTPRPAQAGVSCYLDRFRGDARLAPTWGACLSCHDRLNATDASGDSFFFLDFERA